MDHRERSKASATNAGHPPRHRAGQHSSRECLRPMSQFPAENIPSDTRSGVSAGRWCVRAAMGPWRDVWKTLRTLVQIYFLEADGNVGEVERGRDQQFSNPILLAPW